MKTCTECHQAKPLSEFHKSKVSKDGHREKCAECARALAKAYWHAADRRFTRHGTTRQKFEDTLAAQDGKCAFCHGVSPHWRIDHDKGHCPGQFSCGECIRGILCVRCNGDIEAIERHSNCLQQALTYISKLRPYA